MYHESAGPQKAASGLVELLKANLSRRFLRGNGGFFIWISPRDKGQRKRRKEKAMWKKRIS
jgi:hypothetical protein